MRKNSFYYKPTKANVLQALWGQITKWFRKR